MSVASAKDTNQVNWYSLGYDIAPFSNTANQSQLFFKSQALINTLNKLCSLDSGEVCITALTGERGCGKSTCLRALNKMRTHYTSIIIQATAGLSPQNLVKAIFRGQTTTTTSSRLPTTEDCVQLMKALTSANKQIRILIDKAQELPSTTQSLIRKLCSIQSNGSNLQFVLCTHQPKAIAEIYKDDQIISQSIQLQNLTRQETERFINIKLQSSQTTQKPQQAPKGFADRIYDQTRGNLFKINESAGRLLPTVLKPQVKKEHLSQSFNRKHHILLTSIGAFLLIILGLRATLYNAPSIGVGKPIAQKSRAHEKRTPPSPERISRLLFVLSHP